MPLDCEVEVGDGWAPDARRVALRGNACSSSSGIFSCDGYRSDLDIVDAASGDANRVAHAERLGTAVAFSPDGTSVAYVVGQSIYVSPVSR